MLRRNNPLFATQDKRKHEHLSARPKILSSEVYLWERGKEWCKASLFCHSLQRNKEFVATVSFKLIYHQQQNKLDVDPQRDDDASPISSYRWLLRPTWMISSLWHKSKYKSKFNFDLKKKKVKQNTSRNSISNFFEKKKKSDFYVFML